MKVSEVLQDEVVPVTEEQVVARLKTADWRYEFSDDFRRISSGQREMQVIESMVFRFWKQNPDRAIAMWNEHCPFTKDVDKATVPSFIYRLQSQE